MVFAVTKTEKTKENELYVNEGNGILSHQLTLVSEFMLVDIWGCISESWAVYHAVYFRP